MQTQDSAEFFFKLWPWLEANKNRLIGLVVAIVVASFVLYYISTQRAQKEVDAGDAVTSLLTSPPTGTTPATIGSEYSKLAQTYSGTAAGSRAQLEAAEAQFEAGNYADAQTQFEAYLSANSSGALAATAQLGIGACEEAQNKPDAAAQAYERVVSIFHDSPATPMAQFGLGRIAEGQNKFAEAANYYMEVAQFPLGGSLAQEANLRARLLKEKLAAAASKPAATTAPKMITTPASAPAAPAMQLLTTPKMTVPATAPAKP